MLELKRRIIFIVKVGIANWVEENGVFLHLVSIQHCYGQVMSGKMIDYCDLQSAPKYSWAYTTVLVKNKYLTLL